jgi:DNA-binding GntR family transcriptional regulator
MRNARFRGARDQESRELKASIRPVASRDPSPELELERFAPEQTFKMKVYNALKQAIVGMDIYSSPDPTWIDERQLSERLGVSRTPVREAVAMLEQEGFVKAMPRRGIMVLKKSRREVVEMIQAWAALESMAARLVIENASDQDISELKTLFRSFGEGHKPADFLNEYSTANITFHQTLIGLSGSKILIEMTANILVHVRGIRQITIGRDDRATKSMADHLAIIEALERRDVGAAERLSRDHTLGLAAYVEEHGEILD